MKHCAWSRNCDDSDDHLSCAAAQASAELAMSDARAAADDGWPEDVDAIAWGITVDHVVEVSRTPVECDDCGAKSGEPHTSDCGDSGTKFNADFDEYVLNELVEHESLADRLAELLRSRPALRERVLSALGRAP